MGKVPPPIPARPSGYHEVSKSEPPVNLEGAVKLGIKTLLSLIITCSAFLVAAVLTYGTLVNQEGQDKAIAKHSESSDAHPKVTASLLKLQEVSGTIDRRVDRIEDKQDDLHKDVDRIAGQIDFLTEQAVRQAAISQQTGPRAARRAGDRAVNALRASGDPLQALDEIQ